MKRSEMISAIEDQIWIRIRHLAEPTRETAKSMARSLLDMVENEGMTPPGHEETYRLLDGTYIGKGYVCKWESEDEDYNLDKLSKGIP